MGRYKPLIQFRLAGTRSCHVYWNGTNIGEVHKADAIGDNPADYVLHLEGRPIVRVSERSQVKPQIVQMLDQQQELI